MNWRMMKIICGWICDNVGMEVDSCEGKSTLDDLVASGGMKYTGSVGSGFGSAQCGNM